MGDKSHIEVLQELSLLIQEKDSQNDKIAAEVLIWAHDRIVDRFYPFDIE